MLWKEGRAEEKEKGTKGRGRGGGVKVRLWWVGQQRICVGQGILLSLAPAMAKLDLTPHHQIDRKLLVFRAISESRKCMSALLTAGL